MAAGDDHKVETPNPLRYTARPLVADGSAFANGVAQEWVVPCAGAKTAWVRALTATAGGALAFRLRRTNGVEYPVAMGTADVAQVAATATETVVACKGAKEFVVRFTPSGNGTFTWLDVGLEAP